MNKILHSLAALVLAAAASSAAAADYAVIVNAGNPALGMSDAEARAIVRRLYLKESTTWPDGSNALPLGRPAESPEQQAFLKAVLGMTEAEHDRYWQSLKQTKGETPPREVGSTLVLRRLLSRDTGAVAIFSVEDLGATSQDATMLFRFTD